MIQISLRNIISWGRRLEGETQSENIPIQTGDLPTYCKLSVGRSLLNIVTPNNAILMNLGTVFKQVYELKDYIFVYTINIFQWAKYNLNKTDSIENPQYQIPVHRHFSTLNYTCTKNLIKTHCKPYYKVLGGTLLYRGVLGYNKILY